MGFRQSASFVALILFAFRPLSGMCLDQAPARVQQSQKLALNPPGTNLYKLLEVKETASSDEIKAAYRKLAQKFHPDKNFGDHAAQSKFQQIGEAYEVLSDPGGREAYHEGRFNVDYALARMKNNQWVNSERITHQQREAIEEFVDFLKKPAAQGGPGLSHNRALFTVQFQVQKYSRKGPKRIGEMKFEEAFADAFNDSLWDDYAEPAQEIKARFQRYQSAFDFATTKRSSAGLGIAPGDANRFISRWSNEFKDYPGFHKRARIVRDLEEWISTPVRSGGLGQKNDRAVERAISGIQKKYPGIIDRADPEQLAQFRNEVQEMYQSYLPFLTDDIAKGGLGLSEQKAMHWMSIADHDAKHWFAYSGSSTTREGMKFGLPIQIIDPVWVERDVQCLRAAVQFASAPIDKGGLGMKPIQARERGLELFKNYHSLYAGREVDGFKSYLVKYRQIWDEGGRRRSVPDDTGRAGRSLMDASTRQKIRCADAAATAADIRLIFGH